MLWWTNIPPINCCTGFHLILIWKFVLSCASVLLGTLRNHNGNANENVTWKLYKFMLLALFHDYFNLFNLYMWLNCPVTTGGNGIHVVTENEKFTIVCSCSQQNLEFGHFTLLFGWVLWRNVPKFITHVQGLFFFLIKLIVSGWAWGLVPERPVVPQVKWAKRGAKPWQPCERQPPGTVTLKDQWR